MNEDAPGVKSNLTWSASSLLRLHSSREEHRVFITEVSTHTCSQVLSHQVSTPQGGVQETLYAVRVLFSRLFGQCQPFLRLTGLSRRQCSASLFGANEQRSNV